MLTVPMTSHLSGAFDYLLSQYEFRPLEFDGVLTKGVVRSVSISLFAYSRSGVKF